MKRILVVQQILDYREMFVFDQTPLLSSPMTVVFGRRLHVFFQNKKKVKFVFFEKMNLNFAQ
jgi:hypothetical protein